MMSARSPRDLKTLMTTRRSDVRLREAAAAGACACMARWSPATPLYCCEVHSSVLEVGSIRV